MVTVKIYKDTRKGFSHKCTGSLYDVLKVGDVVGHIARIHPFAWSVRVVNGHFRQFTLSCKGKNY